MRILSVGNSFSQDAHRWLHVLAKASGVDLETYNLYIGGCSLQQHAENLKSGEAVYHYEHNGDFFHWTPISLPDALKDGPWDAITFQQVSQLAGQPDSYAPYMEELVGAVRHACPDAALYFQETWAYDALSDHPGFALYQNDVDTMFDAVIATGHRIAEDYSLTLIPTGEALRAALHTEEFSGRMGALRLYRDGFHLHRLYGRYLAACVWLKTLTGANLSKEYIPEEEGETASPRLLLPLRRIAETVTEN